MNTETLKATIRTLCATGEIEVAEILADDDVALKYSDKAIREITSALIVDPKFDRMGYIEQAINGDVLIEMATDVALLITTGLSPVRDPIIGICKNLYDQIREDLGNCEFLSPAEMLSLAKHCQNWDSKWAEYELQYAGEPTVAEEQAEWVRDGV
jgi:hypothetical protein